MNSNKSDDFVFFQEYYQRFFNDPVGQSWYSTTIYAIIESVKIYELEDELYKNDPFRRIKNPDLYKTVPPQFVIENLIGLILVLCQTYISDIIKFIDEFYNFYENFMNSPISKIKKNKIELLHEFGDKIENVNYTKVEIINALANFYKHREEWHTETNTKNKMTKDIIEDIGGNIELNFYWARNLSKCVKLLGINKLEELYKLLIFVDDWKFQIKEAIPELDSHNL